MFAVRVTTVPSTQKSDYNPAPQFMPDGLLVTLPTPVPTLVTVECVGLAGDY